MSKHNFIIFCVFGIAICGMMVQFLYDNISATNKFGLYEFSKFFELYKLPELSMTDKFKFSTSYTLYMDDIEPFVNSTFGGETIFEFAIRDITNSNKLTEIQKKNFIEYINYLENDYSDISKFDSVHIGYLGVGNCTYYVRIKNPLVTSKNLIYFNYKPSLFEND